MRNVLCTAVAGPILYFAVVTALGQEHVAEPAKPTPQATTQPAAGKPELPRCPIMNEPIDVTVRTITPDGAVYFCCDACIPKYEKEPAKYAAQVAAQREALKKLDRVQVACPLDGNPIDGKTFATVAGQKVAFCGPDCAAKYEKDSAKFKAGLEASYSYQTKCPVSGETINPTTFTDLPTGQRIYFCCNSCSAKLLKDPAAYEPKLAAQGITLDLKKLKGAEKPAGEKKPQSGDQPHK